MLNTMIAKFYALMSTNSYVNFNLVNALFLLMIPFLNILHMGDNNFIVMLIICNVMLISFNVNHSDRIN